MMSMPKWALLIGVSWTSGMPVAHAPMRTIFPVNSPAGRLGCSPAATRRTSSKTSTNDTIRCGADGHERTTSLRAGTA